MQPVKKPVIGVVEHGVPIPSRTQQRRRYPFDEMQVGDSFVVEGRREQSVRSQLTHRKQQGQGVYSASRFYVDGDLFIRVWRLK